MTITESTGAVATAIGQAVVPFLPADEGWEIVAEGAELPQGTTAAVAQRVADHYVAIVVTADMARRIQVGPPPADGLTDGLAPAVQALLQLFDIDATVELEAVNASAVRNEIHSESAVVGLVDGENHLITVVVSPPRAEIPAKTEDSATFQPIVGTGTTGTASGLEVLHEVVMGLTVELGRTSMSLRDILSIVPGSVIELDRAASEPVDVLVNGTLIARGEVVVIDEEFGLRVTEIIGHGPSRPNEELEA